MNAKPKKPGPPWRVLIVDDHPMMRHGLAQFLIQERDLRVCGQAAEASEAVREIGRLQPDLVVLDISLPGKNGIELLKELRVRFPNVKVLVHSMHDEAIYGQRAMRAGAKGYLMKRDGGERLIAATRRILGGGIYHGNGMPSSSRTTESKGQADTSKLSDRELEILELIGTGSANADVAARLHLSVKTVDAHRENIKRKLNLNTSTALNLFAVRWVESGRAATSDAI